MFGGGGGTDVGIGIDLITLTAVPTDVTIPSVVLTVELTKENSPNTFCKADCIWFFCSTIFNNSSLGGHASENFSIKSSTSVSSFALVTLIFKCLGPDWSAVINGKLISVWDVEDN